LTQVSPIKRNGILIHILWFSLKQEGYKPILAETGRQGIDILFYSEEKIDLILLDA
jgi:DNA-binding response OmpR family regulator